LIIYQHHYLDNYDMKLNNNIKRRLINKLYLGSKKRLYNINNQIPKLSRYKIFDQLCRQLVIDLQWKIKDEVK